MFRFYWFLLWLVGIVLLQNRIGFAQCNSSSGVNAGTLTPTASWQTLNGVDAGEYWTFTAAPCTSYTFSFCNNGGNSSWDSEITITDNTGAPVAGAYADGSSCGVIEAELTWAADQAGTFRVYITEWVCETDSVGATLAYQLINQLSTTGEFTQIGDAVSLSDSCLQITANTNDQRGCAWDVNSTLDFAKAFTYDFKVYLGNSDGGADGVAFVVQNDPRGRCACGEAGSALAYGDGPGITNISPIINSLAIELDTYDNGVALGDIPDDHMDILANGIMASVIGGPVGLVDPVGSVPYNVENGLEHILRINWTPGSPGTINAKLLNAAGTDTYATVSYSFDPAALFGTNQPYFGITGSTGGSTNLQSFCLPPELICTEVSLVSITSDTCLGSKGAVIVSVSGGVAPYTYLWYDSTANLLPGLNDSTPTGLMSGTYKVKVLDNSGCEDSMIVVVPNYCKQCLFTLSLVSSTKDSCQSFLGTATIAADSGTYPYTYSWYDSSSTLITGQTDSTAQGLQAGAYTVIAADSAGCLDTLALAIADSCVIPCFLTASVLSVTADSCLIGVGTATLIAGGGNTPYAYSWYDSTFALISTGGDSIANSLFRGTYTVIVADGVGCKDTVGFIVPDATCLKGFFFPTAFSPNEDGANDRLMLYGNGIAEAEIMIYNRWGEKVATLTENDINKNGWDGTYKGNPLNTDVFIYHGKIKFYEAKESIPVKGNVTLFK